MAQSTPAALSPAATAARRSLSLTLQFVQAAHPRRAGSEGGGDRQDRIFVDHRRGARGGNINAFERARAHPQVRDLLAAFDAFVERLDMGAHLLQRL